MQNVNSPAHPMKVKVDMPCYMTNVHIYYALYSPMQQPPAPVMTPVMTHDKLYITASYTGHNALVPRTLNPPVRNHKVLIQIARNADITSPLRCHNAADGPVKLHQ